MDKETIIKLAVQNGAVLATLDNYHLYLIDVHELETFANAIIAEFVSKQVPAAYMNEFGHVLTKVGRDNYIINKCEIGYKGYDIPLYTLDKETK